ncbi:MAG: ATP-binding cassette domain-containing protein, partial [archaeon]
MIKIENLSKKYGRVSAAENISLNIPRGETIAVLGPSGSGKTTLIRVIAGFEQP